MREVLLVWVGRRAAEPIETLAAQYRRRLGRYVALREIRVKPVAGRAGDPRRALAEEAIAIRRHLASDDTVVALDERGRERSTEEFADWLSHHPGRLAFVIGSDLGLDGEFKHKARELLALSRLTVSHQLARLLLLEQLYRVCDWSAGGPYHRSGVGGPGGVG
jgi:23S rRNA (pseudouridine1915-N3)-methyltransferase